MHTLDHTRGHAAALHTYVSPARARGSDVVDPCTINTVVEHCIFSDELVNRVSGEPNTSSIVVSGELNIYRTPAQSASVINDVMASHFEVEVLYMF
jgi:hypothetical protein